MLTLLSGPLPMRMSGTAVVAGGGFEPPTSGLWAQRATELLHPALRPTENKGELGLWILLAEEVTQLLHTCRRNSIVREQFIQASVGALPTELHLDFLGQDDGARTRDHPLKRRRNPRLHT